MSHFKDVCECGITLRQCRCPGPKTTHTISPCRHEEVAETVVDRLRAQLKAELLKSGQLTEAEADAAIAELEAFTEQEVKRIKENRQ